MSSFMNAVTTPVSADKKREIFIRIETPSGVLANETDAYNAKDYHLGTMSSPVNPYASYAFPSSVMYPNSTDTTAAGTPIEFTIEVPAGSANVTLESLKAHKVISQFGEDVYAFKAFTVATTDSAYGQKEIHPLVVADLKAFGGDGTPIGVLAKVTPYNNYLHFSVVGVQQAATNKEGAVIPGNLVGCGDENHPDGTLKKQVAPFVVSATGGSVSSAIQMEPTKFNLQRTTDLGR